MILTTRHSTGVTLKQVACWTALTPMFACGTIKDIGPSTTEEPVVLGANYGPASSTYMTPGTVGYLPTAEAEYEYCRWSDSWSASEMIGMSLPAGDSRVSVKVKGRQDMEIPCGSYMAGCTSAVPDQANSPTHNTVRVERTATAAAGTTSGVTEWNSASGSAGNWQSGLSIGSALSAGLECRDDMSNTCAGVWSSHIQPNPLDPSQQALLCDQHDVVQLEVTFLKETAIPRSAGPSQCMPGSGSFKMLPWRHGDRDLDGYGWVEMVPVLETGTGHMDRTASIVSLDLSDPDGLEPMVIRSGELFQIYEELLVRPGDVAIPLGPTNSWPEHTVSGFPPLIAEYVDLNGPLDIAADITWTCPPTGFEEVPVPGGFVASVSDLGCGPSGQNILLRPRGDQLTLELSGSGFHRVYSDLLPGPTGDAFAFDVGAMSIEGRIVSYGVDDIDVALDEVTFNGQPACNLGTSMWLAE
jgi:hypothetical protein